MNDRNDTVQKFGYFVTTWISSQNIKDTWEKIYLKYRKFLDSSDKIIVKYRTTEASPIEISLTWDNNTSVFSTTTDVSSYVGYEVEIANGTGAGKCAHITSVSSFGSTYFVNLDETFTGVTTGTAKGRIQAWKKISSVSNQTSESNKMALTDGVHSERVQFKVCKQFTGEDELNKFIIVNKPFELIA